MKFSTALTSLILIAPLFAGEAFAAGGFRGGAGKGGNKGGANNNKGATNNTSTAAAAASTSAAAAAANTTSAAAAAANTTSTATNNTVLANSGAANNTGAGAGAGGDPQTSLTLDPSVIAKGFENNGQQVPTAGQVASLTSSNNFINFCALTPNVPITNGQQIKTGSCNPAPMGIIAATTNMPSAKFVVPVNGQNFGANTAFNVQLAINHLETGNFVNAESNYYSAPQQVNQGGDIVGHSHITIQNVGSFTSTTPQDPNVFAFFKGLNTAAVNGVITQAVTAGLPAGVYRICSINTDANHTPCLVAVAQHGMLDDCVYFSVGGNGANNAFGGNATASGAGAGAGSNSTATPPPPAAGAGSNSTATPPPAAAGNATSSAPPAASSAAGAGKGAGQGGKGAGQGGKGTGGRKGGRRARPGRQSRLGRDY